MSDIIKDDVALEIGILASILSDINLFRIAKNSLKLEFFTLFELRNIFSFFCSYYSTYYKLPSKAECLAEIRKCCDETQQSQSIDLINKIFNKENSINYQYAYDRLCEFAQIRGVLSGIDSALLFLEAGESVKAVNALKNISQSLFIDKFETHNIYKDWPTRRNQILSSIVPKPDPVKTGFASSDIDLDILLDGGIYPGELACITALWKTGKTTFLINLGYNAFCAGKNVLHIILEGSLDLLLRKYEAVFSRISSSRLKQRNLSKAEIQHLDYIFSESQTAASLCLCRAQANSISVLDIKEKLLALEKIDLLIVDYGDLLLPSLRRKYYDKRAEKHDVFWDLKNLGEEFNIPIWTATQAPATALGKTELIGSDIAENRTIAQILDILLGLSKVEGSGVQNLLKLKFLARRDGKIPSSSLFFTIDWETGKIF